MRTHIHNSALMNRHRKLSALSALLIFLVTSSGCRAPEGKHYPIPQAEVIGVDLPHKLIIIRHGDIPGLMPAMTMSYSLADPDQAKSLRPGDKISAELTISENVGHLDKIVLLEKYKPVPPSSTATPNP
jgi:Cu/Ag efflux protein CusF